MGTMFNSEPKKLKDLTQVFLEPTNATHRQYETLHAYFVDGLPNVEMARRFAYTSGTYRVLYTNSARAQDATLPHTSQGTSYRTQQRPTP